MNRANKICSNRTFLSAEIDNILKFMSWNGFPKRLSTKLIIQMTPNSDQTQGNSNKKFNQLPKVYIRLPCIGKHVTDLIRVHNGNVTALEHSLQHNHLLVCNDNKLLCLMQGKIPRNFRVPLYMLSSPVQVALKSYIGMIDRCLYTGLNEHATTDNSSEVHKHINNCEHFTYINNLLKLNIKASRIAVSYIGLSY